MEQIRFRNKCKIGMVDVSVDTLMGRSGREGASVVVSARTRSEIEEVAREVENLGQRSLAVQADVSK